MRPVILCGGSGSRLWPLSQPKQFQKIFSNHTMFQSTLLRLKSSYMPPIIATNIEYESLVMSELHALQEYKVIFEPVKIGTAAAILISTLLCNENEIMLILPSDHFIGNLNNFYDSIEKASEVAKENDTIVTFGVKPHEFNSEYGYIDTIYDHKKKYHIVKNFIEKPAYEQDSNHYWNSGIFVFKAKHYISEIKKFAPNLYNLCCNSIAHYTQQEKLLYLKEQDFNGIEDISVDYLVMEKAKNVTMIESDFDWMDVGTWSAILALNEKCEVKSTQYSLQEDNSNRLSSVKYTYTQQNRPLAEPVCDEEFLGEVKMSTTEYSNVFEKRRRASTTKLPSEIWLCKRSNVPSKSLISFVNKIKKEKVAKKEIKPWGFYSIILIGKNFLIKYLFINPLSCTSKQFHNYRDEYHIILSGAGYVSVGNKVHSITQNHMIEIPRNVSHRIENRSENSPLEIIEFQIGEHLSDDDIIRLDDVYGRI